MIRSIGALVVVGAVASLVVAAEKYSSKDGRYSASFPVAPRESSNEIDAKAAVGKIKLFTTSVDVNKNLAFMVIYNDYPQAVAMAPAQKVLQSVRDGSRGATGKIVDDRELALENLKLPAREYILDRDGKFYRSRSILAGTRLYQVVVVGRNKDDVVSKDANDFIDSFEIAK